MNRVIVVCFSLLISIALSSCGGSGSSAQDDLPTVDPSSGQPEAPNATVPTEDGVSEDGELETTEEQEDIDTVWTGSVATVPDTPRIAIENMPAVETLSESNSTEVLSFIISAMRLDRVIDLFDLIDRIEQTVLADSQTFPPVGFDVDGFTRVLECPNGGRYLAAATGDYEAVFRFDDCGVDSFILNGGYWFTTVETEEDQPTSFSYRFYESLGGITTVDGAYVSINTFSVRDSQGREQVLTGGYFENIEGSYRDVSLYDLVLRTLSEENTHLENYADYSVQQNIGIGATNEGDFFGTQFAKLVMYLDFGSQEDVGNDFPEETDGTAFVAKISTPIIRPLDESFPNTGQLDITESVSSPVASLIIQFDNGDPDSFDLFIDTQDVSVTSTTVPWSGVYAVGGPRQKALQRVLFEQ